MVKLRDLTKALTERSIELTAEENRLLLQRAVLELAERSRIGSVIVPLCFAMAILTSGYLSHAPLTWICLTIILLGSAFARYHAIGQIKKDTEASPGGWVQLFFWACLGMAMVWGLTTAIFFYTNFEGFSALLILILSAGIGAGSMVNFCIWRVLTINYLLLSFVPVIAIGLAIQEAEVLPAIVAMVFFVFYLMVQTKRWNYQFWDSLITAYLFERQAEKLSATNNKMAEILEKEKYLRQEVEKGKARILELFNFTNDAIVVCSLNGDIIDVNEVSLTMFPCERERIIKTSILHLLAMPESSSSTLSDHWEKVTNGLGVDFECRVRVPRNDDSLLVHANMRRVTWQKEQIIYVTLRDITAHRKIEDALKITQKFLSESEGYLQAILRNVKLPIYCKDLRGCYLTVNGPFEQLCCRTLEELQGKNDLQVFPENIGHFFRFRDTEIIATGESFELEGTFIFGGQKKNLFVHKFPLKESDGNIYATAGVCTDVTTMKDALHTAQIANEAKSEFLAGMSHELRTPIHSILSVARLGLKRTGTASREKLKSYFSMIVDSGDQLLELLSDMLDLGTLESDRASYNFGQYDLTKDIEVIVNEFKVMMDEREIALNYTCPTGPAPARYDRTKLYQVLRNLLSNAMKFTTPQKEVQIVLSMDNMNRDGRMQSFWKVMVIDQGIGVRENELEVVFGKFVKGSKTCAGAGGVGLGLSICKRIIEDHNGIIWAQQNELEGTTFCFLLPAVECAEDLSQ